MPPFLSLKGNFMDAPKRDRSSGSAQIQERLRLRGDSLKIKIRDESRKDAAPGDPLPTVVKNA